MQWVAGAACGPSSVDIILAVEHQGEGRLAVLHADVDVVRQVQRHFHALAAARDVQPLGVADGLL